MGKRNESAGDDPSSSHRRRSHRSDRRHTDDTATSGDRHRHRRHDSTNYSADDLLGDHQRRHHHRHRSPHHRHHHRRGNAEGRHDEQDSTRADRDSSSHHRSRRERSARDDKYGDVDDGRLSRRRRQRDGRQYREDSRSEEDMDAQSSRQEKHKRLRDTAAADEDDGQQDRKRRPVDGQRNDDNVSRRVGSSVTSTSYVGSSTVDWSSRRGRQRMPGLAYDVDQQKRFLGFLDRRDASGGGAAAMEFTIGNDGLVRMPPPPTLVHRQSRHRPGATDTTNGNDTGIRQQHRRRPTPSDTVPSAITHDEDGDDRSSVASHESLYNDPSTAQMGILPDIVPPSNLYRVALYGVDLSLTTSHLISMVAQLLGSGAKPWRVRRPAREMLHAAVSCNRAARQQPQSQSPSSHKGSITSAPSVPGTALADKATSAASSSEVLADQPSSSSNPPHTVPTSAIGVLGDESSVMSCGDRFVPPATDSSDVAYGVLGIGTENTGGILRNDLEDQRNRGKAQENNEGVLPDASSLPQPPQPSPPAFYLPGLHDVNGPGGMVVLEFTEQAHALRTTEMLNGAYLNGRRVAASM